VAHPQPQSFTPSYGYEASRPAVIDADAVEAVEVSVSMQDVEKEAIRHALAHNRGRRKDAARELQISERTLYRKIKQYGLDNF
jgi:Response regulator containing CheY-like receiver, AAA-type ATPase, and DNA-binding domains